MQRLRKLLDSILSKTTFDMRTGEAISPAQLREIFERNRRDDAELPEARSAGLIVPAESISKLDRYLRVLLEDYIDPETNHIGHAFPIGSSAPRRITNLSNGLSSFEYVSPVDNFARGLIKGAAVLGVENAARLLSGWSQGRPLEYCTSGIINGVTVNETLVPMDGVRLELLPLSTDKLPAYLPRRDGIPASDYLGRTVLFIDSIASPALFRPQANRLEQNIKASNTPNVDIATVCQALSLESNSYVDVGFIWNDCQELAEYSFADYSSWSIGGGRIEPLLAAGMSLEIDSTTGVKTLTADGRPTVNVSEEQLGRTLRALAGLPSGGTRTAVSRWAKSKDRSEHLVDRFIDLRIALESLYLQDFSNETSQEMRFRLSLFGAWHLGADFGDRKSIRKRLREAYDRASGAVHGGKLDHTTDNQRLLSDGQRLCCRGILKLLKEGPPPDWGDVILGAGDDANSV